MSRVLSSSLLFACLGLALGACTEGGDGDGGDGEGPIDAEKKDCPYEEVCSPLTPEGLRFGSAGVDDGARPSGPLALGGRVTLSMQGTLRDGFTFPAFQAHGDRALTIEGVGAGSVMVRGAARGYGQLRITEAASQLLLDKIAVPVYPIERVILRGDARSEGVLDGIPGARRRALAFWSNTAQEIRLELAAAGGHVLLDEALTATASAGLTLGKPQDEWARTWDSYDVAPAAPGAYQLQVTAGGESWPLSFDVVDQIDSVEGELFTPAATAKTLALGTSGTACFNAINAGRNVVGSPWTFSSTGGISGIAGPEGGEALSCFRVKPEAVGPASVTATSGGKSFTLQLTITPAVAKTVAPVGTASSDPCPGCGRGDRYTLFHRYY